MQKDFFFWETSLVFSKCPNKIFRKILKIKGLWESAGGQDEPASEDEPVAVDSADKKADDEDVKEEPMERY